MSWFGGGPPKHPAHATRQELVDDLKDARAQKMPNHIQKFFSAQTDCQQQCTSRLQRLCENEVTMLEGSATGSGVASNAPNGEEAAKRWAKGFDEALASSVVDGLDDGFGRDKDGLLPCAKDSNTKTPKTDKEPQTPEPGRQIPFYGPDGDVVTRPESAVLAARKSFLQNRFNSFQQQCEVLCGRKFAATLGG